MKNSPFVFRIFSPGRTLNPRDLFLVLVLVTSYCVYETYRTVATQKLGCTRSIAQITRKVFEADSFRPFENDLTLEYVAFGQFGNDTSWKFSDCNDKSCTRIKFSNSSIINATQSVNISSETYASKVSPPSSSQSDTLMTCKEIDEIWEALNATLPLKNGFRVRQGNVLMGSKSLTVQIREAQRDSTGFEKLYDEFTKRRKFGWNLYGLVKFYGACVTNQSVRIVQDHPLGLRLCDDAPEEGKNFTYTSCYHLHNFDKALSAHKDKARASLVFAKSLICFLGKIEEKQIFLEDLHGINFVLLEDMSVVFTKFDTAIFHGSRNVYGESICIQDYECPRPNATLWSNGSANNALYQHCADSKPLCFRNRCVGFNASMNLCGIARWIESKVYGYMERSKDRKLLLHYLKKLTRPFATSRATGNHVCRDMHGMLSLYDADKKKGPDNFVKVGYHAVLPSNVANLPKIRQGP